MVDNLRIAQVNMDLAIKALDREIEQTERSVFTDTYVAHLRGTKGTLEVHSNSLGKLVKPNHG